MPVTLATETEDNPVLTPPPNPVKPACPPWCEIPDHDDWDNGRMHHSSGDTMTLASYPCTAEGSTRHEHLHVTRTQIRDTPPVVLLEIPERNRIAPALAAIATVPQQAVLTYGEARALITLLSAAIGTGE